MNSMTFSKAQLMAIGDIAQGQLVDGQDVVIETTNLHENTTMSVFGFGRRESDGGPREVCVLVARNGKTADLSALEAETYVAAT